VVRGTRDSGFGEGRHAKRARFAGFHVAPEPPNRVTLPAHAPEATLRFVSSSTAESPALAARLLSIKPSATASFHQKALDLAARGVRVLGFGVGEPDFATPAHIVEAARSALSSGATRYTSVRGIATLRSAVCRDSARRRGGVQHREDEVVVSVGAKQSLFNLCFALLGPGDEAIVPTPCWVSYPEQCALAGATPVLVETTAEQGYKLTPAALERAITPRTRALFLCSPSNPTGAAYGAEELAALAEVLRRHALWVIIDEIYGSLVYDGFVQRSLLEVAPDLRERIVVVDGVSKRFAMTGFRIGWLLAPRHVAAACEVVQGQTTTSAATPMQHAALAALEGPLDAVETMRRAFEQRRAKVVAGLNAIEGVSCRLPEGAFYAFFDVRAHLGRTLFGRHVTDDVVLAELLLEHAHCALVPGSAFFAPGHLRMSYAASDADLDEGLARLTKALAY
jgi:aspartate aminotransferase